MTGRSSISSGQGPGNGKLPSRARRLVVLLVLVTAGCRSGPGQAQTFDWPDHTPVDIEWSADNEFVLFGILGEHHLRTLYLGDRRTRDFMLIDDKVGRFRWAPRGLRFVYYCSKYKRPTDRIGSPIGTVCDVDPKTRRWKMVHRIEFAHLDFEWLNDGRRLYVEGGEFLIDSDNGSLSRTPISDDPTESSMAPDGSGILYDSRPRMVLMWLPTGGDQPVQVSDPPPRLTETRFGGTNGRWAPDCTAYMDGDLIMAHLTDIKARKTIDLHWGIKPGEHLADWWYWSQDSKRLLLTSTGSIMYSPKEVERQRIQGEGTIGIIERDGFRWTTLGILEQPGCKEDTDERVEGRGFSVWSADGARFVVSHIPLDEKFFPREAGPKRDWIVWEGKAFQPVDCPPGHIAVFPLGSNEIEFLPQVCWLFSRKLGRGK